MLNVIQHSTLNIQHSLSSLPPCSPPPHPNEVSKHDCRIPYESNARRMPMGERHRNARDAQAPRCGQVEHLEIEAEAIEAARRKERLRCIAAKNLESALRIGDVLDQEEPDEE